jgi:hypothetical protein
MNVAGPRPLTAEEIQQELQQRRDSQEEENAQRGIYVSVLVSYPRFQFFLVLGAMTGDSLSEENVKGYMDLLRASGAFDKPGPV